MRTHYEHPANIIHSYCEYAASIYVSMLWASCQYHDTRFMRVCCKHHNLQRAYCMRVRFQIYACTNTVCAQMWACSTHTARSRLACCTLIASTVRAFFCAWHVHHFHKVGSSYQICFQVSNCIKFFRVSNCITFFRCIKLY